MINIQNIVIMINIRKIVFIICVQNLGTNLGAELPCQL